MGKLKEILAFLGSLWGVLTSTAILFPGAASLMNFPIAVKKSVLAPLYPIVAMIVAAFALLLLTVYRDDLAALSVARRTAVWGLGCVTCPT